jgi:hypothetical protein
MNRRVLVNIGKIYAFVIENMRLTVYTGGTIWCLPLLLPLCARSSM